MKIKHIWSVLCEKSIINQEDNVISLIGILEGIHTTFTPTNNTKPRPKKINIPFNFEVINYWTKEAADEIKMQVKTVFCDPYGEELTNVVNDWVFPKDQQKLRGRLKVQGLPITVNGDYSVKISVKTEQDNEFISVADLPLSINIQIAKPQVIV